MCTCISLHLSVNILSLVLYAFYAVYAFGVSLVICRAELEEQTSIDTMIDVVFPVID